MEILEFFTHLAVVYIMTVVMGVLILMMAQRNQLRKPPPGPTGLPLLGYYPFFSSTPHDEYTSMSQKIYGEVFSFDSLGGKLFVVVNGPRFVKEILVKRADEFDGRRNVCTLISWFEKGQGFDIDEGEVLKEHQEFFQQAALNMGSGKPELENRIQDEIQNGLQEYRDRREQPADVHSGISRMMSRIISQILFNKTFDDVESFKKLLEAIRKSVTIFGGKTDIIVGYMLKLKALLSPEMRAAEAWRDTAQFIINDFIEKQIKDFVPSSTGGYVNAYLQHRNDLLMKGNEGSFTMKRLQVNTFHLLVKGYEFVSSMATRILLELSKHTDVQATIQEELDSVVGRERLVSWSDKNNLPYTDATIQELYRITGQFQVLSFYSNYKETRIDGYLIPQRSIICANLGSIYFDPEIYPDPEKFDPNRFLDESGKRIEREGPYPFGLGKRSCILESLAQKEIFIFISSILQNFKILPGRKKGSLKFQERL